MLREFTTELTDGELLLQLRAGSASAFEKIYHLYWKRLLAIAYHHIGEKTASEEAVQEVFTSLWQRRNDLIIESLPNYLASAVKFNVFNQLLKENRRRQLLSQHYAPETQVHPDSHLHARLLEEHIQGIVDKLPKKCRLVFVYSRHDGLSLDEIADKMNISIKTAEAHLSKALRRLRLSLKNYYFAPTTINLALQSFFQKIC